MAVALTLVGRPEVKQGYLAGQYAKGEVDYGAYAGVADAPLDENSIEYLRHLAQQQMNFERVVEQKNQELTDAVANLDSIKYKKLPELMEQHGLPKFEFVDAYTNLTMVINFVDKWRVAMPTFQEGNRFVKDQAKCKLIYEWFRGIGLGGIIKKEVKIPVALASDEFVSKLCAEIKATHPDLDMAVAEEIHSSTLTSQISKLKDAGKEVHELIKVTALKMADVKLK